MTRVPPAVAGSDDAARAERVRAYDRARAAGDVEAMGEVALGLATTLGFGTFPGRVPAILYDAYSRAHGRHRVQLAVALARAWAYGSDPARGAEFATEALAAPETRDDPSLLAAALDAQLLMHWGPDDLDERRRITARLEDVVAHVTDVESRMSAHLWRLTTALECLDVVTVRRQLRALDVLAVESDEDRVRFFAASRRGMYALLIGDLDAARAARRDVMTAGETAGEVDTVAIEHTLSAGLALQTGDPGALAREARAHEEFGLREAVTSIAAEAARLWIAAGEHDRGRDLLHQLAGTDLAGVARDLDLLLTVTSLTEVALVTGARDLVDAAVPLLAPYTGRGVVNAGGVAFVAVVDDPLGRALRVLGHDDEATARLSAADQAYRHVGAAWWLRRLPAADDRTHRPDAAHLRPDRDGVWWVGRDGAVGTLRDLKGLHYLRLILQRPGVAVPAIELSDAVAGHPGAGVPTRPGHEVLDRQALVSYRHRLAEIDADLDQAHVSAETGRLDSLHLERDALLGELRAATGLGGRRRASGGSAERARIAVRKAIAAAIDRIAGVDPSLARLLLATVSTGNVCRYDPDPDRPTRWILSG